MFRFSKPNGDLFNLDYIGPIHCFDSGGDLVATCNGKTDLSNFVEKISKEHPDLPDEYEENSSVDEVEDKNFGNPTEWDEWILTINVSENMVTILKKAIVTAYNALVTIETIIAYNDIDKDN